MATVGASAAHQRLPEAYRLALELHELGLEPAELAARLGIEVCAVGPHLAVAATKLAALQDSLRANGVEEDAPSDDRPNTTSPASSPRLDTGATQL